jgi:hypothetical protein
VILLVILLAVATAGAGAYVFDQIQKREVVSFLNYYHAYDSYFTYELLAVVDVDMLSRSGGNLSFHNLMVAYAFNPPDAYDNVPYLRITYVSGPPCNVSGFPSSVNCHQMLLIIPLNNISDRVQILRAGPRNTFGLDLYTGSGQHIEWRLYLFLATYLGPDENGGLNE